MTSFVALLRAVDVGGTGKLPMADLKAFREDVGLTRVRPYIASGIVVFDSRLSEARVKTSLEARPKIHAGEAVGILVRTAVRMAAVRTANACADRPGNRVEAIVLDEAPPVDAIARRSVATARRWPWGRARSTCSTGTGGGLEAQDSGCESRHACGDGDFNAMKKRSAGEKPALRRGGSPLTGGPIRSGPCVP